MLGGEEVASWNDLTKREGAEAAFDETLEPEPDQVEEQLPSCIRYQPVSAVAGLSTAGGVDKAEERCNNEDLPIAADSQDPLEVGNGRRHGDLVGHDELAHHVELVVL